MIVTSTPGDTSAMVFFLVKRVIDIYSIWQKIARLHTYI